MFNDFIFIFYMLVKLVHLILVFIRQLELTWLELYIFVAAFFFTTRCLWCGHTHHLFKVILS